MADIQEEFVFTRWLVRGDVTNLMVDGLRAAVDHLYDDTALKSVVYKLRSLYLDKKECFQHRDVHTGSVISSGRVVKVL